MKAGDTHLGFVGFGHMGQIILHSIEASRLIPRSQLLFHRRDPEKARQCQQQYGITATSLENLVEKSNALILCVRPPQAESVLADLAKAGVGSKLVISVMAGLKISYLKKYLGSQAQIARVMPNIASSVGEGMSLLSFDSQAHIELKSLVNILFSSLGQVVEIPETQMDIGCGMTGSGPGFVVKLIEAMAQAGVQEGLSYEKALRMAAQTFFGAAQLILKGAKPDDLLTQIATKGGTTSAGFEAMKGHNLVAHFQSVIQASASRSKQISEEFS